jgi:tetratricopeptide (TPR) repeat protein
VRKRKKKSIFQNPGFWMIGLLLIAAVASGWLLWQALYAISPRFDFLLVNVNDEPRKILSGETLLLSPKDKVKVLRISSNMVSNLGVRLVAKDFDVNALRYEEMPISALLPKQDIFDHHSFRILIKYRNQDLGYTDWQVQPDLEDWLEKANRTIDNDQRLAILERAVRLAPDAKPLKLRLLDEYKSIKRWKEAAAILEEMAEKSPTQEILTDLMETYTIMHNDEGIISTLKRFAQLNPNDLEVQIQLAEVLEEKGKLKEAIIQYEGLLKRIGEGDRLPIFIRLGYLYTKIGVFEKAISFYLKAVELKENDANLYYNLSYLYEKTKQQEKADFYLEKAVTLKSEDLEGRLKLAEMLINKNNLPKAEEYLSEVLKENPRSVGALLLMAQVLEKRGAKQELKGIYRRIYSLEPKNETVLYNLAVLEYEAGNLEESLDYFKQYLNSHPEDVAIHRIMFDIYKKQNDMKMAFNQAQILIEMRPTEIDPYHFIFDYLSEQGDYDKLISILRRGLEANSDQAVFRQYLALAYLKKGEELKQARQYVSELLEENPRSLESLLLMAQILEKQGEKEELKRIYKTIHSLEPKNETVLYNLAVLEYEAGNLEESLNYFKQYLKSHPKDVATHEIIFDIYKRQKNTDMAFKEAQVLVELKPKEPAPYHYIFEYLNDRGDYEKIIPNMQRALEFNPSQTDFREYLVVAYLETGKEDLAIEQMEMILKVRPEDTRLLLHLARLQEKQGKLAEALKAYKKIIEISPDHKEAAEAYLRLRLRGVQGAG